jgi:hypothetical protein
MQQQKGAEADVSMRLCQQGNQRRNRILFRFFIRMQRVRGNRLFEL